MKRWFRSRQVYRVFYLFGFVALVAGMLLSMAAGPVQAGFVDDTAAKKKQPKGPVALQETVMPPTDVPPTDVPPTDVPPTDVPPTDVPPTEVVPTEVLPTEVLPTDVVPTEILPTEVLPTEILPTEILPTEGTPTLAPTVVPTDISVALSGDVGFVQSDTPVCMVGGGELSADVRVSLEGGDVAILQTAWRVAEPADLRTPTYYNRVAVGDGDVVSVSGSWPGIRPTDTVVEIHLGAMLLDASGNPISSGGSLDFYWYPWVCPVGAPATAVPTSVLPTQVLPTEVLPTDMTPTEVLPTEVLPTDITPTEVLPTEILPTEILPTDMVTEMPTEMPTELPTEMPTAIPTDVTPGTPDVGFVESDTAVCMMAPGAVSASVQVSLPAGYDSAVLQTAWKVAEPADLRTSEVYSYQNVSNGDTVVVEGQWPGIRAGDQVVEVHLGAVLLDPTTMNPISDGVGLDYYWYPWVCPVGAPATEVPPTEVVPTEVVPTEVVPTEVLPTEVLPTEVLPTEVMPTEVLPTEVVPTEVLPTEILPTEEPTVMPTQEIPVVTTPPSVSWWQTFWFRVLSLLGMR